MFDVNKLSRLYYAVKWPRSFFKDMNEFGKVDSAKINALFKETGAYKKLMYDFSKTESGKNDSLLEKYRKTYFDILNLGAASIQMIMFRDLDSIMCKSKLINVDEEVCKYIANSDYVSSIQSLFGLPENIIDKVSFRIANMPLTEANLQYLNNIKNYFVKFIKESQSQLRYFKDFYLQKVDFLYNDEISCDLYNIGLRQVIENSVLAYVKMQEIKKNQIAQNSSKKSEDKSDYNEQNLDDENKQGTVLVKPHKILSIDDAIEKNFNMFIGLDKVKQQLKAKYALIMKYPKKLDLNLNFRLVGNPGVGKSTMAEVMGKTFYDSGLLQNDTFNEYNGADLKAKFTGHTTAKVKEIFKNSLGGTLLIDEAYSLNNDEGHSDAFTADATSQIVKEVEQLLKKQAKDPNFRTCVILAGYADKIEQLMKTNSGFRRRFPNLIKLPDYTDKQLLDIFCFHMEKDGLKITKSAKDELLRIFKKEREKKDFSNAGLAMNLLQFAEEQQAVRTLDKKEDFVIKPEDIFSANQILLDEENECDRKPIGFGN